MNDQQERDVTTIRVLVLLPDRRFDDVYVALDGPTGRDEREALVGGRLVGVTLTLNGERAHGYYNEEGVGKELPVNKLACELAGVPVDDPRPIAGPLVMCGPLGWDDPATDEMAEALAQLVIAAVKAD